MASTRDDTLSAMAPTPRRSSSPTPCLFRVLEADAPRRGASRHVLRGVGEVHVGRGDASVVRGVTARSDGAATPLTTLTLTVSDQRMSKAHARLRTVYGRWIVEDLGSKNGTRVNGALATTQPLVDGDLVELGHTFFVFRDALPVVAADVADDGALTPADIASGLATLLPDLARELGTLARVAPSLVTVLIHGDTGTGKEVTAQAIHRLSGRSGPLVAVNCGALAQTLLEAELFGFRKGSFSGATEDRVGLVRAAHEGTLFLDEIGELTPAAQVALLRVLQEGQVMPVGATKAVDVDSRIVAATHKPLATMAADGKFRRDLLARLSGFTIELPELRRRREDVGLLMGALVARCAPSSRAGVTFAPEAVRALFAYSWPLNIRELDKVLTTAVILAGDGPIAVEHLGRIGEAPRAQATGDGAAAGAGANDDRPLDDGDREVRDALVRALEEHHGNISAVAKVMAKDRVQIRRWVKRFGVDLARFK